MSLKTAEIRRLDWERNVRVSYVVSARGLKVINNYKFSSIEFAEDTKDLCTIISDIKLIYKDYILKEYKNCLVFDRNLISVRYL